LTLSRQSGVRRRIRNHFSRSAICLRKVQSELLTVNTICRGNTIFVIRSTRIRRHRAIRNLAHRGQSRTPQRSSRTNGTPSGGVTSCPVLEHAAILSARLACSGVPCVRSAFIIDPRRAKVPACTIACTIYCSRKSRGCRML
jgi:hypothetical protein